MSPTAEQRRNRKLLRYTARAQFIGNLYLLCPSCGKISSIKIERATVRIQCTECRAWFGYGLRLLIRDSHSHAGNQPMTPPEDCVFPAIAVEEYKDRMAHKVECEVSAKAEDDALASG